jgi:hypothetical protein
LVGRLHGLERVVSQCAGEGHLGGRQRVVDDLHVEVVPDEIAHGVLRGLLGTDDLLEFNCACVFAAVQVDVDHLSELLEEIANALDFEFIVRDVLDEYRKALRVELTVVRALLSQVGHHTSTHGVIRVESLSWELTEVREHRIHHHLSAEHVLLRINKRALIHWGLAVLASLHAHLGIKLLELLLVAALVALEPVPGPLTGVGILVHEVKSLIVARLAHLHAGSLLQLLLVDLEVLQLALAHIDFLLDFKVLLLPLALLDWVWVHHLCLQLEVDE